MLTRTNEPAPKREFTVKETYQYGVLMALSEEQSEAIDRLIGGSLGWWGRARIDSRVKKMLSLLEDLISGKNCATRSIAIAYIKADLVSIADHGLGDEFYSEGAFTSLESVFAQIC